MSGVYIKGLEMPEPGTVLCVKVHSDGLVTVRDKKVGWIHHYAIPVPNHGELIDRDEYREDFMSTVYAELTDDPDWNRANRIIDAYDMAPVIIPADKEGGK